MLKKQYPLVRMEGIFKRFGGVVALREVNFDLNYNEIVGLVGDNGAGKSTLIKILSGAYPPTSGTIYFEDKKIEVNSPKEAKKIGIETIYQDLALVDNLDIASNIFLGREPTGCNCFCYYWGYKSVRRKRWNYRNCYWFSVPWSA